MSDQRVPILVYHHVYCTGTPELKQAATGTGAGILGEAEFRRQIDYLVAYGWSAVSTTQITDWLAAGTPLPPKAVALHFDNGWLDTAEVVLPILRQAGISATCFPITDGVEDASQGRSKAVRTLTEGVVEKPFMTWDQVQLLVDAGWEIGAHTATHCKLADLQAAEGDEAVIEEALTANDIFVRRLGFAPDHFAYPSGSRNQRTDELLARYYRSLRLWHADWPILWTFTHAGTSPLAIDCQNIDLRVPRDDFARIFAEASAE
jgi:peptidoglycan/xylan/chitin deacetylase (PgdA/CDA1 family)